MHLWKYSHSFFPQMRCWISLYEFYYFHMILLVIPTGSDIRKKPLIGWFFDFIIWSEKVELQRIWRRLTILSKINKKWKCEFWIKDKSIEKVNYQFETHFMCLYTIPILQKVIAMLCLRSPQEVKSLVFPTNEMWNFTYIYFEAGLLFYIDFRQDS